MSYKAKASLKEMIEIETIKHMTPEQINEMLNKQKSQIDALTSEMLSLKAARQSYANLFDGDVGSIHENIRRLKDEKNPGPVTKCQGLPDARCDYLATCGAPCNKCGRIHNPLSLESHTPESDEKLREIKADALFEFQQKFKDWRTGEVKLNHREMKHYIMAVLKGTEYKPPSTERASS